MIAVVALMLLVCLAVPAGLAWRLWRLDEPGRLTWLIVLVETAVFLALILLLGRWDMAGLWSRAVLVGAIVAAALVSALRHARRPWLAAGGPPILQSHGHRLLSLALAGLALAYVASGVVARDRPHALVFPLDGGRFVVAQGGGIGILNHHSGHRAQRHAVDITAVGASGFRASGLLPQDPARYAIFGRPVISPCEGTVVAAVAGLPDLSPPQADRNNPAGNHVVLACGGLLVELAHLRKGSVAVETGTPIRVGDAVGLVGNSGNSTEPHLHIHAVDAASGEGVRMSFDGAVPVRNSVWRR
jgi:hypothetical protein